MTIDTQREILILQLAALSLPVTDYQIQTEVPVLRDTLCDGSTQIRLLPPSPCILTVRCTVWQSECGMYLSALQMPMRKQRSFDTEFAGIQFLGLQITAVDCSVKEHGRTAVLTVSLIGGIDA